MKEFTEPPCEACNAHDELEDKIDGIKLNNEKEHTEIKTSLVWIMTIGSALVTGIVFIFFMADSTEKTVIQIQSDVKHITREIIRKGKE